MSLLSRRELEALVAGAEAPCASIYMATHRGGREVRQGPIRFKNLLKQCEEQLEPLLRRERRDAVLEPARRLLRDDHFWRRQSDGLACFLAPNRFKAFLLPVPFVESAVVNDRFYLKPILPVMAGDGRFYVLAISQKRVRLFEASRHAIREVDLNDVPQSLTDAVGTDWVQEALQFHTRASGAGQGERDAMYHGHGVGTDDLPKEISRFLRQVDNGLLERFQDRDPPLVIAAVEHLRAMYRDVSRYPNLVPEGVDGNPDLVSMDELHGQAWRVVRPLFEGAQREAAERLAVLLGTGRASDELENVVLAAHDGRVDTLFVALEEQRWGLVDAAKRTVETDPERRNGATDLLDEAAFQSLVHDGTIFAVHRDRMPVDAPAAAIFRY
jgi:hypothetical protein